MHYASSRAARRLMALTAVVLFVTLDAAPAGAGPPSQEPTGRFLVADLAISPPKAAPPGHPRGVSLEVDDLAGNDITGQRATGTSQTRYENFRLAQGMTVNYRQFPACTYSNLANHGPPACPRGSKVGTGTIITDFRPVIPTFFLVVCSAFNGHDPNHQPALLIWCKSSFGASATLWFDILSPAQRFGPSFRDDAGPTPGQGIAQANTGAHFTFPDTVITRRGRRIPYLQAPTSCHGSWLFEQVNTRYNGSRAVATSREPCVR